MDHELKQRLIGAVVVTALCAIFIPMLFDDPIDNSGQLVSELNIPEPVNSGEDIAGKLPANTDEVLTQFDSESLPAETAGDTIESTGAEEEDEQPIDESLDTDVVEEVKKPVKATKPENDQLMTAKDGGTKVGALGDAARLQEQSRQSTTPKPVSAQKPMDADVVKGVKKPVKAKKPENAQPMTARDSGTKVGALGDAARLQEQSRQATPKPVGAPKPLNVAVEEAKKPVAVPKAEPSKPVPEMVRWYIQVGSFSQKENALSLWDKLHQQGFPVSLDTIPSEKGLTTYRLRIGPELDGKRAAAMKLKLDKQNIKAILLSE
jgi:DedD protein